MHTTTTQTTFNHKNLEFIDTQGHYKSEANVFITTHFLNDRYQANYTFLSYLISQLVILTVMGLVEAEIEFIHEESSFKSIEVQFLL